MIAEFEKKIDPILNKSIANRPNIRPGDTVKVYQIVKEKTKKTKKKGGEIKERIQIFEGVVLARKHGDEIGGTITVRKVIEDVGVERIFPIYSPKIQKIKVVKRVKVRRAKLYHLRRAKGKKVRLKKTEIKPISEKKISLFPTKTLIKSLTKPSTKPKKEEFLEKSLDGK